MTLKNQIFEFEDRIPGLEKDNSMEKKKRKSSLRNTGKTVQLGLIILA